MKKCGWGEFFFTVATIEPSSGIFVNLSRGRSRDFARLRLVVNRANGCTASIYYDYIQSQQPDRDLDKTLHEGNPTVALPKGGIRPL